MTELRLPLPRALQELFRPPPTPGVLGVFAHLDALVEAVQRLKSRGHADLTVYSPIPRHEIEDAMAQPQSPVRAFTLIGAIAGLAAGAWISLWMSYDWPLVVGGKPVGSIPPYVVIMFEMTILFGALGTVLGVVFNILSSVRRRGTIPWDPRFTNDRFGIFVPAGPDAVAGVEGVLTECGAEETRRG